MYCEVYGQGNTILYLHGWGASGAMFAPVIQRLPSFCNVAVDFDGFGKSPPPPKQGFTVFDYAERTARFLRERGETKVTIVAHSFGCRVAMVLAVVHPELVDKMLLFAPAGLRRFSLKRWCKIRLYKLTKRLRKGVVAESGSDDYKATAENMRSTFVKVVNKDLSAYARKIACKTLIIAGKQDTAVPFKDAVRLSRLIKNSDFVSVEGDHFALFYSPEAFAEIVRLFAEEQC